MVRIGRLIPIKFESHKLSDDYIQGGGFFTGAFVGMQCQDTSGQSIHADFDYFIYKEIRITIFIYIIKIVFSLYFKPY